MINVPAIRLHQFGVFLYQAILGARDVDRLVRFEVLSYGHASQDGAGPRKKRKQRAPKIHRTRLFARFSRERCRNLPGCWTRSALHETRGFILFTAPGR